MQGDRSHSGGLESTGDTDINFAVPPANTLRTPADESSVVPRKVEPGLIHSTISSIANAPDASNKTYVFAMDWKKVSMELTASEGDVDMFGCEDGLSLADRKRRYTEEVSQLSAPVDTGYGRDRMENTISILSKRLQDAREIRKKREYALNKFLKLDGGEWRKSKYMFVISAMYTSIYQINDAITNTLDVIKALIHTEAVRNDELNAITFSPVIDLSYQSNYVELKDTTNMPAQYKEDTRFLKQGTDAWLAIRKQAPVTGSSAYSALGMHTLKKMKSHIKHLQDGTSPTHDPTTQERLDHGRNNEVHAIATLVCRVLPMYFPGMTFYVEGAHFITDADTGKNVAWWQSPCE